MKKLALSFGVLLLLLTCFSPAITTFAAEKDESPDEIRRIELAEMYDMPIMRKTVAEIIGSFAFNLLGVDRDKSSPHQQKLDTAFGMEIIGHLDKRTNDAGTILKKLVFGDYDKHIWRDIADFLIPTDDEYVEITVTDELKSAIGEAVVSFNDEYEIIEDDYDYLGHYDYKSYGINDLGVFFIPYVMPLDAAEMSGLDIRIIGSVPVGAYDNWDYKNPFLSLHYDYTQLDGRPAKNAKLYSYIKPGTTGLYPTSSDGTMTYFKFDMSLASAAISGGDVFGKSNDKHKPIMTGLGIRGVTSDSQARLMSFDVYIKALHGSSGGVVINKGDIFNSTTSPSGSHVNYADMTSKDIYNYLNTYTPSDVTVNHYVQNDYNGDFVGDYDIPPYMDNSPSNGSSWGFITTIVEALATLASAVGSLVGNLLGGLKDLVLELIHLIIPNSDDIRNLGENISAVVQEFVGKFEVITSLGNVFGDVFKNPSGGGSLSLFDIKVDIFGTEYMLLPSFLRDSIGTVRTFLSGVIVLFTGLNIYKRFVGSGDVIKS